uniref:U2A'/phosphoprotein 32 family A C-terminal domain-containing protein n=1 Tax=Paramormyrops kingsleyae TaxID=1676925 RepID=A0A3B3QU01_9TELE
RSSGVITNGNSFQKSNTSQSSDLGDSDSPLARISRERVSAELSPDSGIVVTPLPSSRFKYLSWHKLDENGVQGNQLICPRVREPPEEELYLREQEGFHEDVRRRRRRAGEKERWEERLQENWENCVELNLSFQDLGDPYQSENFFRILRRLIRVEKLQLVDNALRDLSSIRLPCKSLNLHRNYLTSVRQLPKIPQIQHLVLSENGIEALGELVLLGTTPLHSLTLCRNPCAFLQDYRAVFSCLPKLKVLDGIPKLPEDSSPRCPPAPSRTCTIL